MAGSGYGVTPMSRSSQHSSCRRHRSPQTGKHLDLSSPNVVTTSTRKKTPKRKTLSSRYSAELPSKRRKLALDANSDPINLAGTAVSLEACHTAEVNQKERESKHLGTRGRARKAGAKAKKARAKSRTKAIGAQLDLKKAEAPKVFSSKVSAALSDFKAKLLTSNENTRVGVFHDRGNLSSSSIEKLNLKAGLLTSELNQVGQDADRHPQASNRGRGRKGSSKKFSYRSSELRTERIHEEAQPSDVASPSLILESQAQGSVLEDSIDGSSFSRKDSCLLEGRFLRPRRNTKKKSKFDELRLPPQEYVGKRVVVYWPHAKAWYAGKVIKYDDLTKKHKIKYDDNDEECISFRRHKVVLETSPSTQLLGCPVSAKGAPAAYHSTDEDVATDGEPCKSVQLQADFVEDNALLSAFASRQRFRDSSHELLCNRSVKLASAAIRANSTPGVQKASKSSMSSVARGNAERTSTEDRGNASGGHGSEAAFVYVRRTKGRQNVDISLTDLAAGGRVNDTDSLLAALQHEVPRKRKKCQRIVQQQTQLEFNSNASLNPPIACDENGAGGSASEHSSRKRNKRSLKKLVSQSLTGQGTEVVQGLEPQCDRKRKQIGRRTGRKFVRKHKLASLILGARDGLLPTKRLSYDAESLVNLSVCDDAVEQHDSEVLALALNLHNLFDYTIHLVLPVVTPDLFTWHLFGILSRVNFCEASPFNERFLVNGSLGDWKSIFRIVSGIVKAMPLSAWMNGRQWQCRILHELSNVIPRSGPALTDMFSPLPAKAENVIVEHMRGAILSCKMTSRQILNLFVCYFIKPYIVATVCEKGASFKAVVQQILLLDTTKEGGITCLRKSLKSFPIQSTSGSADLDFLSYLMLFPSPVDWCTEEGLFLKQMEQWIEDAACVGYVEKWVPVLTLKKSNYLGWQITSAHLVNHGYAVDDSGSKVFKLGQGNAKLGMSNYVSTHCSRHAEQRGSVFDQTDGWAIGFDNCSCLNSALLCASFLQRGLYEAIDKGLGSVAVCSSPSTKALLLKIAPTEDQPSVGIAEIKLVGVKKEFELGPMIVSNCDPVTKHVKSEPEVIISRRNSSITTESNGTAIKEESSVEMYGRLSLVGQLNKGFPSKSDEQHFSGQMDQEYYLHKRSKVKKSRPRFRSEQHHIVLGEMSTYCCGDLLFRDGDAVVRECNVRVEVQPNGKVDFMVAVHLDGTEVFLQRLKHVSILKRNPPELRWNSGNGWALEFPDREQWDIFRGIYNELCIRILENSTGKEIPVPLVKGIEGGLDNVMVGSSIRPYFAIKYPDDEVEAAFRTGRILYDLDSEDEAWMVETNRISGMDINDNSCVISDDALEQIIDRLEKEAYRRGGESIAVHDGIEVCQDLGEVDILQAVHLYWSNKRRRKGKALLRYFQPPLWEQYQAELRTWEARMEQCPPHAQAMLMGRYPRPVMSAFCLQSRTLDGLDTGKRMLRQRSQRKIKPPSRSSSDDSHRLSVYRYTESARLLPCHSQFAKPSNLLGVGLHPSGSRFQNQEEQKVSEEIKAARATAVEARKLATKRSTKLQRCFLEFDLSLQRAWALLIEYEAVAGVELSAQSEALEQRMSCLFGRCSSLLSRGDDSSEDEPQLQSGQVCKDVGEEFVDAFKRKCSLNGKVFMCGDLDLGGDGTVEEACPLLPISGEVSSYAWNGSSLL